MFLVINAYLQHINFAKNCYDAYRCLFKGINENSPVLNESPGFFTISEYALSKCLLLELAKMFRKNSKEKTVTKLINTVRANMHLFIKGNVKSQCEYVEKELNTTLKDSVEKLMARRDQDLAHNDPMFFFGRTNPVEKNYISPEECEALIFLVFNFCNDLLRCLSTSESPVLYYGADDLNNLLNNHRVSRSQ